MLPKNTLYPAVKAREEYSGGDPPSDDATAAPHESDAGVVELPLVLLGGLAHHHESLGVGDDLGGIEGLSTAILVNVSVATKSNEFTQPGECAQ